MSEDGHGQGHGHGRFRILALHGAMLRKHLLALAAPKHRAATGQPVAGRELPTRHRMGQAFCDCIESRRPDTVTDAGGVAATVVVTMGLDALLGGLAAAPWTPAAGSVRVRRVGWRAGPASSPPSSAGPSQVLDLGRKTRFHTGPQRIASRYATAAAPPRNATGHPAGATPTTTSPGTTAATPT